MTKLLALPAPKRLLLLTAALAAAAPAAAQDVARDVSQPAAATGDTQSLKNLSLEDLMDVEVTSVSRYPEKLLNTPSAIQVITSQDIADSTASNLPEALRLADNLEVAQENSHDWAISARGFNANLADKLLVLIDGRAVYTPLYGGVLWNVQDTPLEDVDRIEVISGPGGVQWGANAMNGVINITTKGAQDTQGLYVEEAGAGDELRDQTEVRYGGKIDPGIYYRVYGEYTNEGSEVLSNGASAGDTWNMARGGFRVDSVASASSQLTLQGDAYDGTEYLGTTGDEDMSGGNVLGHWSHTLATDSDMSLVAYFDDTHLSVPYLASPASPPYYTGFPTSALVDDLDTWNVDFQHHIGSADANQFVWGLSYRFTRETDTDQNIVQFAPVGLEQNLYGGFVEDNYALTHTLRLSVGSKLEHNDYTGWEGEPSVRLAWNLSPKQLLWAAVSRAVQTPSRYDHDLAVPTGLVNPPPPYQFPTYFLTGSRNFAAETEIAYEAGYRVQLSDKGSVSVSAFDNAYSHLRSVSATPTTADYPFPYPYVFQNGLEGYTYGAELSGDYQMTDWWRLHAGYDLLHENIHPQYGYADATGAANETADPQYQANLRSSFDLLKNLQLDADARWVGKFAIDNGPTSGAATSTVPGYSELGLHLAWHITKRWELSAVGQNLLRARHQEYGYLTPATEFIERTAYLKAELRY